MGGGGGRGGICSLCEKISIVACIARGKVGNERSTPTTPASPPIHLTLRPSLTALCTSPNAPFRLSLSTNTTTAQLPLCLSSPFHTLGNALSSSSTTPSATTFSSLFRLRPLCAPVSTSSVFLPSSLNRLCAGAAGIAESKSTLSTRRPPSWSAKSWRMFDSEASMGTLAMKRLRFVEGVGMEGAWALMYR